ncbi:hypothetical protein HUG17_6568 [Dermatophagoides farinae]|uniref:Uncharacterized protein n=1 Tax=Dermatophagoides farinae TaxID=6954 RepID=A0A9D4P4T1_DERFA|nr:hypothetical protein HUG17_6568 [Dermatophagoides farinae]
MFDATVLGCTGSTALTMNITATQAFCVISQCLGQIRQQPVFLGRRKRDSNSNMIMEQLAPIQRYKDSNLDMINQSAISTLPVEYRIEKENDDDDDTNEEYFRTYYHWYLVVIIIFHFIHQSISTLFNLSNVISSGTYDIE